jgi:AcrR family transcriptional regulator
VSPRGVAVPDVREQLFAAAERVLLRAGPAAVTGREVTREAGVATGLLNSHFTGLDEFLAQLVLDRGRRAADEVAHLRARTGRGDVLDNVAAAALSFGSRVPALAALVRARPALADRLGADPAAAAALTGIEREFAAYLDAERELGRIAPDADTPTLALAVIGTVHHLVATDRAGAPDLAERVRRIVKAVLTGVVLSSRPPGRP